MGGCTTSTLLGGLFLANRCSGANVADRLAWFPPDPATYRVEDDEDDASSPPRVAVLMPEAAADVLTQQALLAVNVVRLHKSQGGRSVGFLFNHPGARCVLLFAHGNAMDCGLTLGLCWLLSVRLRVSVMSFEYTGYGCASGSPSLAHVEADAEAAYQHLMSAGWAGRQVLLYGQSIGSHAMCVLAAKHAADKGGAPLGLALHTPLLSALRVLSSGEEGLCAPTNVCTCFDVMRNYELVQRVACPVYVVHGTEDQEVHWSHGVGLADRTPKDQSYPMWLVDGAGHNNVLERAPEEYCNRLSAFISHCLRDAGAEPLDPPPDEDLGATISAVGRAQG